jgi:fatty acid-binding protein DegV
LEGSPGDISILPISLELRGKKKERKKKRKEEEKKTKKEKNTKNKKNSTSQEKVTGSSKSANIYLDIFFARTFLEGSNRSSTFYR